MNNGSALSGAELKRRRIALGMNVATLAKLARIDRGTLKRLEEDADGVREITLSVVDRALTELEQSPPDSLGTRVRLDRTRRRMTQQEYANTLDMPVRTLQSIESNEVNPQRRTVDKLVAAGIDVSGVEWDPRDPVVAAVEESDLAEWRRHAVLAEYLRHRDEQERTGR